mmetsp:Transcript_46393/g.112956  ORF Transcript_46393/g.112956 Transcript_46393/m.112956 type:complete len:336 (+) Transcript_46393:1-1008(+)
MRAALALGVLSLLGLCHAFHGPALPLLRAGGGSSIREGACSRLAMCEKGQQPQGVGGAGVEPARLTRRLFGAGVASAAVFGAGQSASALKWSTIEKIAEDPSLIAKAFDPAFVDKVTTKWREQIGVAPVSAADYTLEYDEFVNAVRKAGKAKIGGEVVENPSEEQLLNAWKVEERRRAELRAKEGKEPLTRPVKVPKDGSKDQYDIKYMAPLVTNKSSPEALQLGKYLKEIGATMYGAYWCTHCYGQKQQLGYEAVEQYLDYVECDKKGANGKRDFCKSRKVAGFPTWEIRGELYPGELTLDALAELVGFDLKAGKPLPAEKKADKGAEGKDPKS